MRESFVHSTENSNTYLYDVQHSFSMLIHPELKKAHEKSTDIDSYYLKKYEYLKKQSVFGVSEPDNFETTLDESTLKRNIIQARQIVFETTDHCNLRCPYCSLGELYELAKKGRKNINTHSAINLLKYIFDLKPKNTQLLIGFFGGEPLMNFKFIEKIIEVAYQLNTEKKLELVFNMTTNATLLHKYIQFLVDNNFRLLISLDGDEKGQSYRVFAKDNKSSFQKVIENVDMIQRDFPEYFIENVEFNAVLHNRNSVKDIHEFIYGRYHKTPTVIPINSEYINPDKKELFEKMFHSKWKSEEEYQDESGLSPIAYSKFESYTELRKFLHNYSINYYISNLLYLLYNKVSPIPTGTCFPFSRKIFLDTHNNLLPCEKISHNYSLGKVNNSVIIDVDEISRKYKSYYNKLKKICRYCYAGRFCPICMLTISNLDKIETKELSCYGFQDQEAFRNKLNRVYSLLEKYPSILFQILNNQMID